MTLSIDLYYTMRSPYCYLSTVKLVELNRRFDLDIELKPVYPLAVSDPTFFERANPMWPPYLVKDTNRIAARLGIPFRWPRPDPIVQDLSTRKIAEEQPYIRRLTLYAQLAAEAHLGLAYIAEVSTLLFNPEVDGWDQGSHLEHALARAGLKQSDLDEMIAKDATRIDARIAENRADQLAAGHWGAPLFVHEGEIFFGQDRLDDLLWYLQKRGLQER